MRLWHYKLLPFLPDYQLKGQYRELIAIMRNWRDKGSTKSVIIDIIKEYPKNELYDYFQKYSLYYSIRFGKSTNPSYRFEFVHFCIENNEFCKKDKIWENWHNEEYLRVCMANLYEKYKFGRGKSRISEKDWKRLLQGYKTITGEDYML